jgi:hypothetical protein
MRGDCQMVRISHQVIMMDATSDTITVTAVISDISMRRSCQTMERSPGRSASQAKPKPSTNTSATKNNRRIIIDLLVGRCFGGFSGAASRRRPPVSDDAISFSARARAASASP